ncbi:hypothetical protein [Desertibacillus haloalkaliphilus]|uniref:hypothetical protein n=1 Tax=Desertibacillus haloalkaliphilus TaxID=1328930 RepID=UPI001C28118C|nr:hypothetical protein [Desertibacillus haloalkaliphilus]MBU8908722.1 hypothetical protein [Desertibacillus haloalkaliphilus]
MVLIGSIVIVILIFLYNRYVPIMGLEHIELETIDQDRSTLLDVRDFSAAYHQPVEGAINIPLAYLKRYYRDVGAEDVYILSAETIDVNMSGRLLSKKGIRVKGYHLIQTFTANQSTCRKGSESYGIQ